MVVSGMAQLQVPIDDALMRALKREAEQAGKKFYRYVQDILLSRKAKESK